MAEQSLFDLTWARQDQWGGEWHGLGGRFGIALRMIEPLLQHYAQSPVDDMALDEWRAWVTDQLRGLVQQHQPAHVATVTALIAELRDILKRPVAVQQAQALLHWAELAQMEAWPQARLANTQLLFDHLCATNFDFVQLQHLRGLFRAQTELALAYHGLFGNGDLRRLEPDAAAPLIHVNAELMAKCATDFRLAQQAVQQRQRLDYGNGQRWLTWEGHMLYLADLMAYACLEPLKAAGLLSADTAVVTYFQQQTEIRLIPYYNIVLIGLPSWVQNLYDRPSSAFLVIPHEVGHALYRFGPVPRPAQPKVYAALAEGLAALQIPADDWRAGWVEELFADAFGCLIAGPISVLGMQEYLATGVPAHFSAPGQDHPTAAMRPLIQSEILRILDERGVASYKTIPDLLDQHWQIFLANNGGTELRAHAVETVDFPLPGANAQVPGRTMLDQLRPTLSVIVDLLLELFPAATSSAQWSPWSTDLSVASATVAESIAALQAQFQDFYCRDGRLQRPLSPPPVADHYQPSPLHTQIGEIAERIQHNQPPTTIPKTEWHQLFLIDGWTDEGGKAGHIPQ